MNWYQITVHTVTEAVEAISYAMEEMGPRVLKLWIRRISFGRTRIRWRGIISMRTCWLA